MTDHDKLIQLVESHPVLWDQSLEGFKDRDEKGKAWKEVAMDMDEHWDLKERKERIAVVKKQWKHIRDAYMRSTRPPKSGDAASKKKKYVYADALTFLKNSLERRRSCGNFEQVDLDTPSQPSPQGANEEEREDEEDLSHGNVDGNTASSSKRSSVSSDTPQCASVSSSRKKVGGRGMTKFQSVPLEKIGETTRLEEDADCKFLLSLHPKMAKLTESQKTDFQLHCLLFFKDLQNSQSPYTPRTDSPSLPHSFPSVPQNLSHHQRRPPFLVPHFPTYPFSPPSSPLPLTSPPPYTTPQNTSQLSPQRGTTQSE